MFQHGDGKIRGVSVGGSMYNRQFTEDLRYKVPYYSRSACGSDRTFPRRDTSYCRLSSEVLGISMNGSNKRVTYARSMRRVAMYRFSGWRYKYHMPHVVTEQLGSLQIKHPKLSMIENLRVVPMLRDNAYIHGDYTQRV